MQITKLFHKSWVVILVVCFGLMTACDDDKKAEEEVKAAPVAVKTATVSMQMLRPYIELNGNIEARSSVKVYPNISGKIAGTKVNLGSAVKKGDSIVLIDPSIPGVNYSLSNVPAPISGYIISIPPKPGIKVTVDTPIVTIGDLSQLEVKTYIPEKYFGILKPGMTAEITVEAYRDVTFSAAIKSISPVVDETSRTVETILVFDRKDNRITAGMFSKIKLYLKTYEDAVVVPETAIAQRNDVNVVFTIDSDGKAKAVPITSDVVVDGMVRVLSGISVGEYIITEGINAIQDGVLVSVLSDDKTE